jgi:transposase InsO family protein
MKRQWKPPSQSWRTFLANHLEIIAAIDFFAVHTATFRILYVFVVIEHGRRCVVHFNVTSNSTAQWAAQQILEAFPFDIAPRYLVRDNDGIYGPAFRGCVRSLYIKGVPTAPRSPCQNTIAERIIGTLRREVLKHVIVLNERHLRRLLKEYVDYYHRSRTHLSLDKDPPEPRDIESGTTGNVVPFPVLAGLHHRYSRVAA